MKIGILGDGQLARMLTLAAYPLGLQTLCFSTTNNSPASKVGAVYSGNYADNAALQYFAEQVDVITYETENIPLSAATFLAQQRPLYPSVDALKTSQDRLHEKTFFQQLDIPTPRFAEINTEADLLAALKLLGLPAMLKTRRFGYDGKGQYLLRHLEDVPKAWAILGEQALIVEAFIAFDREVSLISVRDNHGQCRFYPLAENQHKDGILRMTQAPYVNALLQQQAERYAEKILNALNYIGVLAIEFFCVKDQLLANEMAPRVHNSGHWTIEGADTSQFENHVRAICGLPVGSTASKGFSIMLNIISEEPPLADILALPSVHYHTYEKVPQHNRKLGHVALHTLNEVDRQKILQSLHALLKNI